MFTFEMIDGMNDRYRLLITDMHFPAHNRHFMSLLVIAVTHAWQFDQYCVYNDVKWLWIIIQLYLFTIWKCHNNSTLIIYFIMSMEHYESWFFIRDRNFLNRVKLIGFVFNLYSHSIKCLCVLKKQYSAMD